MAESSTSKPRKFSNAETNVLIAELDKNKPKALKSTSTTTTTTNNNTNGHMPIPSSTTGARHKTSNSSSSKKKSRLTRNNSHTPAPIDALDDDWLIPSEATRRSLHEPYAPLRVLRAAGKDALKIFSLSNRLWRHNRALRQAGATPIVDPFDELTASTEDGVPLGGVGSHGVGRGWRGDFNRWALLDTAGAEPRHGVVPENQFSIYVAREAEGHVPVARVLHPGPRPVNAPALGSWDWGLARPRTGAQAARHATPDHHYYHSLYPRAWTTFETALGIEGLHLTCKQLSPVIADNYRDSSAPVCVFVWRVQNDSPEDRDVSIMMTFRNGDGSASDLAGGHNNESYRATVSDDGVLEDEDGDAGVLIMRHKRRTTTRDKAGRVAQTTDPVALAIAAHSATHEDSTVTMCQRWRPDDDSSARALWRHFTQMGEVSGEERAHGDQDSASAPGEAIGGAVAVKVPVAAGETAEYVFVLGWHAPLARFANGDAYWRRYTRFYGRDVAGIKRLVASALLNWRAWQAAIVEWQRPIMQTLKERDHFAAAMFNELHWLNDGGSLWIDGDAPVLENDPDVAKEKTVGPIPHTDVPRESVELHPRVPLVASSDSVAVPPPASATTSTASSSSSSTADPSTVVRSAMMAQMPAPAPGTGVIELRADDVGHFVVLSSAAELTFNAVDSQFFASSWALLFVFPLLEMSVQRDAAAALFLTDREMVPIVDTGKLEQRKLPGHIAHDLGAPSMTPWRQLNAYTIHNTNNWRDLPAMYVLQVYRDYVHTRDQAFAADVWPAVERCIEQLQQYETHGNTKTDGLIAHAPGSVIDTSLGVHGVGVGAYINSLWLGALTAAIAMAAALGIPASDPAVSKWRTTLSRGKISFHSQLWNVGGQHYDFDSGNSQPGMCLASQLIGQWYVDACRLEPIVSRDHVQQALRTIFHTNVVQHGAGERGASLLATSPASTIASSKTGGMGGGAAAAPPPSRRRVAMNAHVPTTIACVSSMRMTGLADESRITLNGFLRTVAQFGLQFALPVEVAVDGRVRGRGSMAGFWSVYWSDLMSAQHLVPQSVALAAFLKAEEEAAKKARQAAEAAAAAPVVSAPAQIPVTEAAVVASTAVADSDEEPVANDDDDSS